jgi:hypothetical protein
MHDFSDKVEAWLSPYVCSSLKRAVPESETPTGLNHNADVSAKVTVWQVECFLIYRKTKIFSNFGGSMSGLNSRNGSSVPSTTLTR